MHSPSQKHLNVATQILRYLKGTLDNGFCFGKMKNGELWGMQMWTWKAPMKTRELGLGSSDLGNWLFVDLFSIYVLVLPIF